MKLNIKPLMDRVLIKAEKRTKSDSGIVIPDSVQANDLVYGYIESLGPIRPDYVLNESLVKNARVCFVKYSGTSMNDGDDTYWLVRYDDIIAIVTYVD